MTFPINVYKSRPDWSCMCIAGIFPVVHVTMYVSFDDLPQEPPSRDLRIYVHGLAQRQHYTFGLSFGEAIQPLFLHLLAGRCHNI